MTGSAHPKTDAQRPDAHAFLVTEESVYGTLLVSGMIVVSGSYGATSWETFLSVLGTVIVFWAAHVYAGTVASHGVTRGDEITLGSAFRHALRRSVGFFISALPPLAVLLFGALRVIPDPLAMWFALWLGVVILGALGYIAFTRRGSNWKIRILGTLGTAALGVAMILLKVLIH